MSLSLNEMEALSKRATRGGGYSWGLAEEAAKATRWLCAQGLDGGAVLAELLEQGFAVSLQDHALADPNGPWQGNAALCPLLAGVTLSDCADRLAQGPVEMRHVAQPALILPFAAHAARRLEQVVTVTSGDWTATTDGTALSAPDHAPEHAALLRVEAGGTPSTPRAHHSRATPAPETQEVLNRFAHRIYAPATEESRLLGAGAGLSDND
ncbi:DUF3726 domain-containing protein [Ruegeria sp. 2012CJ41-6]|uniref:DUF3726 domain-containing protein n=1 Tax=Ruegeria spongiae TaxID=2942209 RepID=A0ABT0Q4S2_9RHOB|nr:DUF3726 domain-containing protein [Ruegeria spongiae]MCL6284782.1 DUF3726 domain-containing protein [Ruegeria spongiae]